MRNARAVLGLVAGGLMVVSSAAHTLLGWPAQGVELARTTAGADLVTVLEIGWRWGGAAMLVLGVIVMATFVERWRGERIWMLPAAMAAVGYVGFGAWALFRSQFDPFFFVFVIPGVLLAIAVTGD